MDAAPRERTLARSGARLVCLLRNGYVVQMSIPYVMTHQESPDNVLEADHVLEEIRALASLLIGLL